MLKYLERFNENLKPRDYHLKILNNKISVILKFC